LGLPLVDRHQPIGPVHVSVPRTQTIKQL